MIKKVLNFLGNHKLALVVWVTSLIILLFAPKIRAYYLEEIGKPLQLDFSFTESSYPQNSQKSAVDNIVVYDDGKDIYNLQGWAFSTLPTKKPTNINQTVIILFNDRRNYAFDTRQMKRQDVVEAFKDLDLKIVDPGFSALINKNALRKGEYCIGVLLINDENDEKQFFMTNKVIKSTPNSIELTSSNNVDCESYLR